MQQQPLDYQTPRSPGARGGAAPMAGAYTLIAGAFLVALLSAVLMATLHEFMFAWLALGAAGLVGLALGLWRVMLVRNEWMSGVALGLLCGGTVLFFACLDEGRQSTMLVMLSLALVLVVAGMVVAGSVWRQGLAKVVLALGTLVLIFGALLLAFMSIGEGLSAGK